MSFPVLNPSPTSASRGVSHERPSRLSTLVRMAAAAVGGGLFALAAWLVLNQLSLPAFSTSMVTRSLATAGTVAVLVVVGTLVGLMLLDDTRQHATPRWRSILTHAACYLSPAALVITTTALPLSPTRLYLDGIQVDQGFRTQFLTRAATTLANQDMNYVDMPSYYPLGWFWLGGRLANVLGMPGWEAFQPWSIVSLAIAGSLLVPVWQRLTGSLPLATGIAVANLCVTLVMSAVEPYAAIVALGAPAAVVMCAAALRGSWFASTGVAVYLGVAAMFYTLFTAVVAIAVVTLAVYQAVRGPRRMTPLVHLVAIGVGSILLALITWGPFLMRAVRGSEKLESTANHYLPAEGATLPLPFLAPSVVGILCLIGVGYLVLRVRDVRAQLLLVSLAVCYLWMLASMVTPLFGTSMLGFRVELLAALIMVTAGMLGLFALWRADLTRYYPQSMSPAGRRSVAVVGTFLLVASGVNYAQSIPGRNEGAIDHAYRDTDGYGDRADRFPADAASSFNKVDDYLREKGFNPLDTVVWSDETAFFSYFPYFGFNAFTSHYANPIGEFSQRNAAIARWAELSFEDGTTPESFQAELDNAPWRAPDVFIFRGDKDAGESGWKTHLAEDIFPNQPNVRFDAVFFNPAVFDSPNWDVKQLGPFVVVSASLSSNTETVGADA